MKRFASHYLFVPEIGFFKQQVVEIEGEFVSRIFPLTEEIESVEWMPGLIVLCPENEATCMAQWKPHSHPWLRGETHRKGADCDYSTVQKEITRIKRVPYLLYPFDFTSMQPVAETQHKQLR